MSRLKIGNSPVIKIVCTISFYFIMIGLLLTVMGCSQQPRDKYAQDLIAKLDKLYTNLQQYRGNPFGITETKSGWPQSYAEAVGSSTEDFASLLENVNYATYKDIQEKEGYEVWANATYATLCEKADKCLSIIEVIKRIYRETPDKDKSAFQVRGQVIWLSPKGTLVFMTQSGNGISPEWTLNMLKKSFRSGIDAIHRHEIAPGKPMAKDKSARPDRDAQLIKAAEDGNMQGIQTALANGADVNSKDANGTTALWTAAENGHTEIVKLLLEKGADMNVKATTDSVTALMIASQNGHAEIVKLLLGKGADVNAKANDGFSAVNAAKNQGHTDIVQLLEKAGAKE